MQQIHFIQKLYTKFFPKNFAKGLNLSKIPKKWENLSPDEKKKLANDLLAQGEDLLSKEDLNAIKLFNEACQLDPENPFVWYRQGLAFLKYSSVESQSKALHLASKNFKIASSLDPEVFDFWISWANVLLLLGTNNDEYSYFLEAKKKYKHAISISENQSKKTMGKLYWDYALVLINISTHSGEAIDLKKAIELLLISHNLQTELSSAFLYDLGDAYLKMGLLINETNMYLQAISYFKKSLEKSTKNLDAWIALADAYTQLYINTLDEVYFKKANEYFEAAIEINPLDPNIWLEWAHLLGESGKINKDPKKLRASIEKCIRANRKAKNLPSIIGQWSESLALLGASTNRLDLILDAESKIVSATDQNPQESSLWHAYGICMVALGIYYNDIDYDYFAIEKFQNGLSVDRTDAELWYETANAHAKIGRDQEHSDMLERAVKFYQKAIDLKPACPILLFDYAKALTHLGEITSNEKTLKEAIVKYETALALQKNAILQHPDWLFYFGVALDLLGDLTEKESYYKKAIEIFNSVLLVEPDFPKIHYRLSLCFSHLLETETKLEYLQRANTSFNLAIKQDPEDDEVWLEWGLMLISFANENLSFSEKNDYLLNAEQKISKSGSLGNPHAYYHLACLYSLTNRFDEAMELLNKANKLDVLPPIDEILEDEWLENLRSQEMFTEFLYNLEGQDNKVEEY
ncbi:MAG: hypothetical protein K1060chlam5_00265 [Candidatus Anoxychlamydiales bacterium]|nr:hypothetical protein [Candidatus Anoxychlamydiales bacterium]